MLRRATKCLLMPLLLCGYVLFARQVSPLVIAAILCGFVGDVFLLLRPRRWAFLAGIVAFAAGHVFYIVRFIRLLPRVPAWHTIALLCVFSVACAVSLTFYIWRGVPRKMRPASFLYMFIIGAMASSAILFAISGVTSLSWLAALGGLLFVASDTTLSIDAFHHPVRYRNVIVMSTYIAAQTLIVCSLAFV